jgi:hypothetical protein
MPKGRRLAQSMRCLAGLLAVLVPAGCSFGPKMLERTHGLYNESVKQTYEEQLLLNIVRLRYNDTPAGLDVTAIAAQHELSTGVEARPFFATDATNTVIQVFSRVLPFAQVSGANRPTFSLVPSDDQDTIRRFLTPIPPETLVFLTQSGWPVSTVLRLWVDEINGVRNAPTAAGPPQPTVPEAEAFLHLVQLLQVVSDLGYATVVAEERATEVGGPLPAAAVTSAALVEAAKSGYEYRPQPGGQTWVLVRKSRRLVVRVSPAAINTPEVMELVTFLRLKPGLSQYEVILAPAEPRQATVTPEQTTTLRIVPRAPIQVAYFLAHGVIVPAEHLASGASVAVTGPDGMVFDWQQVLGELFTVRACKQRKRPPAAYVAVYYRGYWFYIDDRDHASKVTFGLMFHLNRLDFGRRGDGRPLLTLPVGR